MYSGKQEAKKALAFAMDAVQALLSSGAEESIWISSTGSPLHKRKLYEEQKTTLDLFLEHGAISKAQYDKSLHDLTVKMGYEDT